MLFPEIYHIGCLKTGTTSLQKIWSEDDRINLIQYSRYFNKDKWQNSDYDFYRPGKINIESDENIVRKFRENTGLETALARIKEVRPDAKIVLTIREQRSMLLSMYKHHIRQTHDSFSPDEFLESKAGKSFLEIIYYADIYNQINRFFPGENIFFFLFEEMTTGFQDFIRSIYRKVFGIEPPADITKPTENIGLNDRQILLKKRLNALYLAKDNTVARRIEHILHQIPLRIGYALTSGNREKHFSWQDFSSHKSLEEKFRANNRELQQLTGLNLERYGYLI